MESAEVDTANKESELKGISPAAEIDDYHIHHGDNVIFRIRDDRNYLARIYYGKCIELYNYLIPCSALLGQLYGRTFSIVPCNETENNRLSALVASGALEVPPERREWNESRSMRQQRENTSRKLTFGEITVVEDLTVASYTAIDAEQSGSSLDVLADEDLKNTIGESDTFRATTRSEFGKQKWVERNQARHGMFFVAAQVTAHDLAQYKWVGRARGDSFLSSGSLSLILQHSNVSRKLGANRVLVYDDLGGDVSAALASRLRTDMITKDSLHSLSAPQDPSQNIEILKALRERGILDGFTSSSMLVVTGKANNGTVRQAMAEINLTPPKFLGQVVAEGFRCPRAPFAVALPFDYFMTKNDNERLATRFGLDNSIVNFASDVETEEQARKNILKFVADEYDSWCYRRAENFGLITSQKIVRKDQFGIEKLEAYKSNMTEEEKKALDAYRKALKDAESQAFPKFSHDELVNTTEKLQEHVLLFDALVVATMSNPEPILEVLSRHLQPGASVVVFSPNATLLAYTGLRLLAEKSGMCVKGFSCNEHTWQFLPARSHCDMSGEGFGGYVVAYTAMQQTEMRSLNRKPGNQGRNVRCTRAIRSE